MVSVDLTAEETEGPAAAGIDSPDEAPPVESPSSHEEVILSDQTNDPAKESKKITETEKKPESVTESSKIDNAAEPPAQTGGFTSLADYYQFIMLHKKIFVQKAGSRVNELLGEALKMNTRQFYGGTAIVYLKFGPDRKVSEVLVDSASPDLRAFLEEISWAAIPPPASFSLRSNVVQMQFTVLEGYLSFRIDPI